MVSSRVLAAGAACAVAAAIIVFLIVSGSPAPSAQAGPGGGPGGSYLGLAEAQSLFGPGNYTATGDANATELGHLISSNSSADNTTAFLSGNVTAYWQVLYNMTGPGVLVNGTQIPPFAVEQVFETTVPRLLYSTMLETGGSFNTTNQTIDGTTYSYSQQGLELNGTTFLIAYKGSEVALVYALGKAVNVQDLASAVAGDMP